MQESCSVPPDWLSPQLCALLNCQRFWHMDRDVYVIALIFSCHRPLMVFASSIPQRDNRLCVAEREREKEEEEKNTL